MSLTVRPSFTLAQARAALAALDGLVDDGHGDVDVDDRTDYVERLAGAARRLRAAVAAVESAHPAPLPR